VRSVGVFLSSSKTVAPIFLDAAELLGEALAKYKVVFGGSNTGCMGALAKGVLNRRGVLVGVVPEMDFVDGVVQEGMTEKVLVPDMAIRKQRMFERSDAFVVFPGGIGTLDELFDVLALRQIGVHQKPTVLYNYLGYWGPLVEALETFAQQRMIAAHPDELFVVLDRPQDVINYLDKCAPN
jgi:uncharacterized protein (TIGR00730 family)